jgi:hypothetical protein
MSEAADPANGRDNSNGGDEMDQARLENTFKQVADQRGAEVAAAVRLIIQRNLRSGRLHTVLAYLDNYTLEDYVWRVADRYQNPGPYLVGGPEQQQPYSWETLFPVLQRWAYNWYLDRGFTDPVARDRASAGARQAALLIIGRSFPYDTEFDVWALTLLRQACAGKNRPQGSE